MLANFDEDFQTFDEDREYHRAIETDEIDWEEFAYEINDPKHPNYHETFSDLADLEDIPF